MERIKTIASVRSAKPIDGRRTDYPDADVAGLALRVAASGKKSWSVRYRTLTGDQRRLGLGSFPAVGLADARLAALAAIGAAAAGSDPTSDKRTAKVAAQAKKLSTVGDLMDLYLVDAAKGRHRPNARPQRESTLTIERDYLERLIRPRFGSLPIHELKRADVQRFVDEVAEASPGGARHCRNLIRQSFNYALRREAATSNPAQLVEVAAQGSRDRVLSDEELRLVWIAARRPASITDLRMTDRLGLAICLAMLTLQRGGEVCGLQAKEVDWAGKLWTIPGERTKNHLTHVVPLSAAALAIINQAFSSKGDGRQVGFAFPSPKGSGGIARRSLSAAMGRLAAAVGVDDCTPHDFRRTGSTNITGERIGISRFIVSRILNQASDTGGASVVTGVYDRNEYLSEKRRALDAWAALLMEIVGEVERPSNVLAMKA